MLYSIVYANKAHVDVLASKNGYKPTKTASKHGDTESKMLIPGGVSTYSKKSGLKEGGQFDFYGGANRNDFSRISQTTGYM